MKEFLLTAFYVFCGTLAYHVFGFEAVMIVGFAIILYRVDETGEFIKRIEREGKG